MTASDVDRLLRDEDLAEILNCSTSTVWRRVADGTISPPLKIGGMSRWPASEAAAVIERANARRLQTRTHNFQLALAACIAGTRPVIDGHSPAATPPGGRCRKNEKSPERVTGPFL